MVAKIKKCLQAVTGIFHTVGGIAALNRLAFRALVEEDCDIDVFSLNEPHLAPDSRYIDLAQRVNIRGFAGDKIRFTAALWQALLTHSYDLVLFDHVNLASAVAPLAWIGQTRYVVWLCGIEVFPPRPDWQGYLGLRYAGKRLAISEFTKECILQRFPKLRIEVCDLALDPIRHSEIKMLPESQPLLILNAVDGSQSALNDQVILSVGRMVIKERYKGHSSLMQAFPAIAQQNPRAQLVLAGDGNGKVELHQQACSLPSALQSKIFFPGYVSDELLDQLYRACSVFAMPSIGEGFGLVYLEAMSRGRPCLGGRVDATPYVVRDGLTGLLVDDPRSPEQVAAALNWFLAHPEESRVMGRKGLDLVNSYYLFPHFKQRFWRLLLGGRS